MRIGIDLGGTKTEIICLNSNNGKELYRHRVPTPKNDYQATIKNMADMVFLSYLKLGEKGTVGVGIPGTISSITGNVKNANSTWLNGNPLDKDLGNILDREVKVENDANCFAVSEATDGAARGAKVVFGVIIGTGCGGGVVAEGKPISGLNGIGGEWGHNPLPMPKIFSPNAGSEYLEYFDRNEDVETRISKIYKHKDKLNFFTNDWAENEYPGQQCYCGKRGCIETWLSGTGFKNDYIHVTGETLSTHDIIANAQKGEEKAVAALNRYIDRMAKSLAGIIDIIDPDVIVLGGGMSNITKLYDAVPAIWDKYIFSDDCHTKLVPPRFGDSSGVRGAAWLWSD